MEMKEFMSLLNSYKKNKTNTIETEIRSSNIFNISNNLNLDLLYNLVKGWEVRGVYNLMELGL